MTIQEAITKAIEGGYITDYPNMDCNVWEEHHIFLDPLFWQSLGKAMEWEKGCSGCGRMRKEPGFPECVKTGRVSHDNEEDGWKIKWHRFIDHLADGKDAESFFENLS